MKKQLGNVRSPAFSCSSNNFRNDQKSIVFVGWSIFPQRASPSLFDVTDGPSSTENITSSSSRSIFLEDISFDIGYYFFS